MNSKVDIGLPWCRPRSIENSLIGLPFIYTDCLEVDIISLIQRIYLLPNPMISKVYSKNCQFTISNAFSKSNLRISPLECLYCKLYVTSLVIKIQSATYLPFTNAVYSSAISFGSNNLILFARILRIIFIEVFIRLIRRKSDRWMRFVIFGTRAMKEELIPFDNVPFS